MLLLSSLPSSRISIVVSLPPLRGVHGHVMHRSESETAQASDFVPLHNWLAAEWSRFFLRKVFGYRAAHVLRARHLQHAGSSRGVHAQ